MDAFLRFPFFLCEIPYRVPPSFNLSIQASGSQSVRRKPFGVTDQKSCMSDICITILNSSKLTVRSSDGMIVWLEVTTACGTALKSRSMRKVGNHCEEYSLVVFWFSIAYIFIITVVVVILLLNFQKIRDTRVHSAALV